MAQPLRCIRCRRRCELGAGGIRATTAIPAPPQRVTIGYVEVAGDARYEPITGFGRLVLKTRERPFAGAQVGLDEAQALTRVLKTEFALERISVPSPAEVAAAVVQARDARGIHFSSSMRRQTRSNPWPPPFAVAMF